MKFESLSIKGSFEISPTTFDDHRGFFGRVFCANEFFENGLETSFVQINHSGTIGKGSLRGMHFQFSPSCEIKVVKCIVGSIFDVIIDLRVDSPTFMKWIGIELSAKKRNMIYIPKGFAHGFQSLSNRSEIVYLVSSFYNREAEGGVRFNDPLVNINWPLPIDKISEKDLNIPLIDPKTFVGIRL